MMDKKRVVVAQMSRRNSEEEKCFDRKFWSDVGHEARFSAAWDMVREVALLRGERNACESGLQRSVCRIYF